MDSPTAASAEPSDAASHTVILNASDTKPISPDQMIAGTVTLGAACPLSSADRFDHYFQSVLRCFDLVYRIDDRRWVWIFDTPVDQMKRRLQALNDHTAAEIDGVRLSWSHPLILPVNDRSLLSRVSDLLVRETLSSQTDYRFFDRDSVRPGTSPIEASSIATARLDEELRRMMIRLRNQTTSLRRHARNMRPSP